MLLMKSSWISFGDMPFLQKFLWLLLLQLCPFFLFNTPFPCLSEFLLKSIALKFCSFYQDVAWHHVVSFTFLIKQR